MANFLPKMQNKIMLSYQDILSVTLILFSIIDIPGSIPFIIDLRKKKKRIHTLKATIASGVIMIIFLFLGEGLLSILGVDLSSFALAGAVVIFLIGLEMVLDQHIFKSTPEAGDESSIFPLAFPLIAGAGTLTTIISLKSNFNQWDILIGILLNLIFVYFGIKGAATVERVIGVTGTNVLRKVFGIILLAISIKIFKTNWAALP